ncbi:hypothetical protein TWF281_007162 [Arthrobotrys megalospora]
MSILENIPLEIKIEVIESLDSIYDLDALSATCTTFHKIIKDPRNIVGVNLGQLLHGDLGEIIRLLFIMRAYGRDGQLPPGIQPLEDEDSDSEIRPSEDEESGPKVQSLEEFFHMTATDKLEFLQKLFACRKTIRWFTDQYISAMADKFGESLPNATSKILIPSRTEIARLDRALLLVWLVTEMYHVSSRGDPNNAQFFKNCVGGKLFQLLIRYTAENFCAMYSVGMFVLGLMTPAVLQYARTLGQQEIAERGDLVECIDNYHKIGIPHLILLKCGLDGYREHLIAEADVSVQNAIIGEYYDSMVELETGEDDHCTPAFINAMDEIFWTGEGRYQIKNSIALRPLLKESGTGGKNEFPIRNKTKVLDFDAMFCDDHRLEELGYSKWVYNYKLEDLFGKGWTDSLAGKLHTEACECEDGWGCPKKYEIWKNETGYSGDREDAPGWGVHFKRREEKGLTAKERYGRSNS